MSGNERRNTTVLDDVEMTVE